MPTLKNPRLKKSYHLERINTEQVMVTSEGSGVLLSSRLHTLVLDCIAQQKLSTDELLMHFMGQVFPHQIFQVLDELEQEGYITEAYDEALIDEYTGFWESLGMNPQRVAGLLQAKRIAVSGLGKTTIDDFEQACTNMGLQFGNDVDLQIIITDRYDVKELEEVNQKALNQGKPWMLIQPTGTEPLLGPIVVPNKTACWKCLHQRLELNHPHQKFYQSVSKSNNPLQYPSIQHPAVMGIIYQLAVLEIVKWFYQSELSQLESTILAFDSRSLKNTLHQVVKRPQCPACGSDEQDNQFKPIQLHKKQEVVTTNNGYRAITAEEALGLYAHHISEITGIVPFLKLLESGNNNLIHNYLSGPNMALASRSKFWLNQHRRSANAGKGKTAAQAKMSALGEAIERYSLMHHGRDHGVFESYANLDQAIHPNACMNFSAEQFVQREQLNAQNDRFYALIPKPLDEQEPIAWTPVYSLTHKDFKYLPSAYCYAQYPGKDEAQLYAYPDSNGCAAGSSLEEAILQGFLELVERDAVAIWWYNRIKRPAVQLDCYQNTYVAQVVKYYQSVVREVVVLDLTTDLAIPTFAAVSYRRDEKDQILFGFGAHLAVDIAIERAITEMNQLLPVIGKDGFRSADQVFTDWLSKATLSENDFMVPLDDQFIEPAKKYPLPCESTIYDSLIYCIEQAQKQGLETLALDLTQPDIGMPVAKVIVPELRHFWKRFAAGRLYDVPVKMGWLSEPLTENELNPLGFFL